MPRNMPNFERAFEEAGTSVYRDVPVDRKVKTMASAFGLLRKYESETSAEMQKLQDDRHDAMQENGRLHNVINALTERVHDLEAQVALFELRKKVDALDVKSEVRAALLSE